MHIVYALSTPIPVHGPIPRHTAAGNPRGNEVEPACRQQPTMTRGHHGCREAGRRRSARRPPCGNSTASRKHFPCRAQSGLPSKLTYMPWCHAQPVTRTQTRARQARRSSSTGYSWSTRTSRMRHRSRRLMRGGTKMCMCVCAEHCVCQMNI